MAQTDAKELRVRVHHTYAPPAEAENATGRWTLRIEAADAKLGTPVVRVHRVTTGNWEYGLTGGADW